MADVLNEAENAATSETQAEAAAGKEATPVEEATLAEEEAVPASGETASAAEEASASETKLEPFFASPSVNIASPPVKEYTEEDNVKNNAELKAAVAASVNALLTRPAAVIETSPNEAAPAEGEAAPAEGEAAHEEEAAPEEEYVGQSLMAELKVSVAETMAGMRKRPAPATEGEIPAEEEAPAEKEAPAEEAATEEPAAEEAGENANAASMELSTEQDLVLRNLAAAQAEKLRWNQAQVKRKAVPVQVSTGPPPSHIVDPPHFGNLATIGSPKSKGWLDELAPASAVVD